MRLPECAASGVEPHNTAHRRKGVSTEARRTGRNKATPRVGGREAPLLPNPSLHSARAKGFATFPRISLEGVALAQTPSSLPRDRTDRRMARLSLLALVFLAVVSLAHAVGAVRVGPSSSPSANERRFLAEGFKPVGDRFHVKRLDLDEDDHPCLPPCDGPFFRWAGYFKLDRTYDAHMFFFFFESRKYPDTQGAPANNTDPLVVWMTGGPGCSSEIAAFYENGPYHINGDLTLADNPYGWDATHNMIFVDQPIGTGFSWSDHKEDVVYDERTVVQDMWSFLGLFMGWKPQFNDNPLFITGESYAGHYVPAVTRGIYDWSKEE